MPRLPKILIWIALLVGPAAAEAQSVSAGLSAREAYVGQAVMLQIQVANARTHEVPDLPKVDGLEIKQYGAPQRTFSFISGQGQSTSVLYRYQVTPRREGSFRIPPISVEVHGTTQRTSEFELIVSNSETGDLLFVEVDRVAERAYVGQPIQ